MMLNKILKPLIPIAVFFFLFNTLQAQCPDYNLTLETQEEIDQFAIEFPNCKDFKHDLQFILYDTTLIQSMEPLSIIESIGGALKFSGNYPSNLTDLYAFRNLQRVQEFNLHSCNIGHIHDEVKFKIDSTLFMFSSRKISSLGSISLSKNMITVQSQNAYELPGAAYEILSQVDTVKKLSLSSSNIESLGTEYDIYVDREFSILGSDSLMSIAGINFNPKMESVLIGGKNMQGPFSNLDQVESIVRLIFRGGDFMKTIPIFTSLKTIRDLDLYGLSELTDLSALENVEIGRQAYLQNLGLTSYEGLNFSTDSIFDQTLRIQGLEFIEDCTGLEDLKAMDEISISDCPSLKSLKGLESLKTITDIFRFTSLPQLQNFKALTNLKKVNNLEIYSCNVHNLDGLESLDEIDASLSLIGLPHLKNINALGNLKTFGLNPINGEPAQDSLGVDFEATELFIRNNDSLETLFPIANIDGVIHFLHVVNNPLLSTCSILPICNKLSTDTTPIFLHVWQQPFASVIIENNSPGCNSINDILESCSNNQVLVFHDMNEDNLRNVDEIGLSIGKLKVNDFYEVLPNHNNGVFNFFDVNASGQIEYLPEENWKTTGPTNVYNLTVDNQNKIEIGIVPTAEVYDVDISLAYDLFLCDRAYDLTAIVRNTGTVTQDIDLEFRGIGTLTSNFPDPDNDGFIEFTLEDMLPGETRYFTLAYTAPSVMGLTPGDVVQFTGKVSYKNADGNAIEEQKDYDVVFLCAYDPNDKQVFPAGVQEENYTLFEDNTLEYKIRFQNTGNFPAEDILIVDTLSEFLDFSTLEYIHASHPVTEIKLDRNVVSFTFEDINLIDSIANEPESHGYVQFSIETLEDLNEFTVIENTAHIYFDSNPAIVTNTVFNTFVSEIPMGSSTEDLEIQRFQLMPNPSKDFLRIETTFAEREITWTIYNQIGQVIIKGKSNSQALMIDLNELEAGLYFFQLNNVAKRFVKINQ